MARGKSLQTLIKDLIPTNLTEELIDLELTSNELLFVGYICTEGFHRPDEAYLRSHSDTAGGLTKSQLRSRGLHLMGKENVRKAVQKFITNTLEPFREQFELQQVQFWQTRASWNPLDFFKENGDAKPLDQIPKHAILALDNIKKDYRGKEADREVIFYDLASRAEAMKQLQDFIKNGKPANVREEDLDTKTRIRKILDKGKQLIEDSEQPHNNKGKKKKISVKRTTEEVTLGDDDDDDDDIERDVTNNGEEDDSGES